ncbi:hypothetical protein FA13DRAFT_1800686 [Coprinellus micaceus]|uniref:Uncharacterized protein n=1 Tax=Coprinellus micaceus TaxID=71717 RepID=A0A4Y7SFP9_COPMI|nr:hypothetical protein FA13DRAFT_1800686 [Coprinellus micaceus]
MAIEDLPGFDKELVYALVAFWVGALFYGQSTDVPLHAFIVNRLLQGAYFTFFVNAFTGIIKRWGQTSWVFFAGICVMFLPTTLDMWKLAICFNMPLRADKGELIKLLWAYSRWDMFGHTVLQNTVIWTADILAIYRCYVIWSKNWKVIVVLSILIAAAISKGIVGMHFFLHQEKRFLFKPVMVFLRLCYPPPSLLQNIITTGLMSYKIWKQDRLSRASGVRGQSGGGRISLSTVNHIIWESGSVYTVIILISSVAYQTLHRSYQIIQAAMVSSSSMVFVILAVTMNKARKQTTQVPSFVFPSFAQSIMLQQPVTATFESRLSRRASSGSAKSERIFGQSLPLQGTSKARRISS